MKNILQLRSGYSLLLLALVALLFACTEEITGPDILAEKDGPAVINYVRVTDPEISDSLLVSAFLGNLVAIIGDNLGDTKELWFNDQKALLNPTYVTDKSIIVNVPTTVPVVVTDEMRLVFSDGSELNYPFRINVPEPQISGIKSEYVPDGGTAIIYGDFFFDPMTVTFAGDVEGSIVSLSKTEVQVVVPEGAQPGPIKISTNFGTQESGFLFRDDRNILLDFDTKIHETWTARIGYEDVPGVSPISGNFAYFQSESHGAWQWVNEMTMQYWAPRGRGDVPVAKGLVSDLVFKMEVNVPMEWKSVRMEIFFAPSSEDHGRDVSSTAMARWQPWKDGPYTTDGWQTLSIPLSDFVYNKDDSDDNPTAKLDDVSNLANITIMLFGPADDSNPVLIAFDNVRVVPIN
jgi:hypothetical protein